MRSQLQKYLERLDFHEMGRTLSAGISECTAGVAAEFPAKEFYGFALDCNFSVGSICFSLADKAYLATVTPPEISAEEALSLDTILPRAWSLGDWPFYCVNDRYASRFVEAWLPWESLIETVGYEELYQQTLDAELSRAFNEYLANWAAEVLANCEALGAFDSLTRTNGFGLIVLDHDEDLEKGLFRMRNNGKNPFQSN
ncbi:MAG: DUF4303 domain-containing protein [Planctomycetales bacterium]|nr:DUF4303 domain-containing protein [Planctomycetales bacterium]